ncbi:MAG: hypothetical protein KC733_05390 [Candidatus Omnitrophica bacterium]|nr:hypothetical protein [Candidatus Omnitrophota bacterium]
MENIKRVSKILVFCGLSIMVLGQANQAYAGYWRRGYDERNYWYQSKHHQKWEKKHDKKYRDYHHDGHTYGKIVWGLPYGSITLVIGGDKYYYHDGHYYRRYSHGYKSVHAPIGACLRRLPRGYKEVHYGGKKFYRHNDVYYKHTPQGYVVIREPYVIKEVVEVQGDTTIDYQDNELVVNVPNDQGGYTPVKLTREGEGFVGPQGEYYPKFPKVERLKLIYGTS